MLRRIALALIVAGLAGCAGEAVQEQAASAPVVTAADREDEMNRRWRGHDYDELIATWGKPVHEMTIPRVGWPDSRALLYGQDPETGCIDAFVVVRDQGRRFIESYFCR